MGFRVFHGVRGFFYFFPFVSRREWTFFGEASSRFPLLRTAILFPTDQGCTENIPCPFSRKCFLSGVSSFEASDSHFDVPRVALFFPPALKQLISFMTPLANPLLGRVSSDSCSLVCCCEVDLFPPSRPLFPAQLSCLLEGFQFSLFFPSLECCAIVSFSFD